MSISAAFLTSETSVCVAPESISTAPSLRSFSGITKTPSLSGTAMYMSASSPMRSSASLTSCLKRLST